MLQPATAEVANDQAVVDITQELHQRLFACAALPSFQSLKGAGTGSKTVWGIPTPSGALIYAERVRWGEHTPPTTIDGASGVDLTLQRPGQHSPDWSNNGGRYSLMNLGDGHYTCPDDYTEDEYSVAELNGWADVESASELAGFLSNAIHRGNIHSTMHRAWPEYMLRTRGGYLLSLLATAESSDDPALPYANRSVTVAVDTPGRRGDAPKPLWVDTAITQNGPQSWALSELNAFGAHLGIDRHEDRLHHLTNERLLAVRGIGSSLVAHCEVSLQTIPQHITQAAVTAAQAS